MNNRNDGGPAFPVENTNDIPDDFKGMSLRDWFAGQALAGICGNNRSCTEIENSALDSGFTKAKAYAREAYKRADAMLAERERDQ